MSVVDTPNKDAPRKRPPRRTWNWGDVRVSVHGHPIGRFAERALGIESTKNEDGIDELKISSQLRRYILDYIKAELPGVIIMPGAEFLRIDVLKKPPYDEGRRLENKSDTEEKIYAVHPFFNAENGKIEYHFYVFYYRGHPKSKGGKKSKARKRKNRFVVGNARYEREVRQRQSKNRTLILETMWVIDGLQAEAVGEYLEIGDHEKKILAKKLKVESKNLKPAK